MNIRFEEEHNNENIISVAPTIDIPLVSDLNNNNIQQQFHNDSDKCSTEMVTIQLYEPDKDDKEPVPLMDLCLLQTDKYDTELDEIFDVNTLITSKDTENSNLAELENVIMGNVTEVEISPEHTDVSEITAESENASTSNEKELEISQEQRESTDTESYEVETETVRQSRKRKRNYDSWNKNVKKRRRQIGKEYETQTDILIRAREVKTKKDCIGKCRYKCATIISNVDRQKMFKAFWKLSDSEKKSILYEND